MTKSTDPNSNLEQLLRAAQQKLACVAANEHSLLDAAQEFSKFADAAQEATLLELHRGADMLSRILELASYGCSEFEDAPGLVEELVDFSVQSAPALEQAMLTPGETGQVDALVQVALEKWNDYLELIENDEFQNDDWELLTDETEDLPSQDDSQDVPGTQIELLLSALSGSNEEPVATLLETNSDQDAKLELVNDREMLEAYLDDAVRCLSTMEQAAMEFENDPQDIEPVRHFCRELHTLKGASATVGLAELASYVHELESNLESLFDGDSVVEADLLLEAVDHVRNEIATLQPNETTSPSALPRSGETQLETAVGNPEFSDFASSDDSSVRIRASKLDRLMDMLAELVVLRNRRESHVAEFNQFNQELAGCASRLGFVEEQSTFETNLDADPTNPFVWNSSCTFSEIAKDITAVSNGMRELQKPVSQDNAAISGFIRDFRQELMQLRRIPVSGLFNRLQRAARDAAKSENKQVRIKIVGEHAGLEQEIQERLFESLLHVVRNSVSHGIESESSRLKAGKAQIGTVTLEASSSAQLLIIEVRDDGAGLDHDAIRVRAIEKGLISPDHRPSNQELVKLIFAPGFSTRQQASQVSGRGVGMDIVSKTIEQLHGRIEIDSVAGQGTSIRISIPLRTGIEHVMVFRSGGQLFALPMQSVTAAKSSNSKIENIVTLSLASTLTNGDFKPGAQDVLLLRHVDGLTSKNQEDPAAREGTQMALAVDELIGPEEVVVRGLPNLLKHHPLFCGVTLSGSGEKVILLDSERVVEFCHENGRDDSESSRDELASAENLSDQKRALIVDDSLTARKALAKILHQQGFTTVEAGDGVEAVERLHKQKFDLVFTDLDMPRLGGLELLSDIQSSRYCDAPVVVVSSRNAEAFKTKAMDVGATDYITKPVSEISITQLLENLQLLTETQIG